MYYAQKLEDKQLREYIGEKDPGIYVDVGAWHPHQDSVTKHFFERRWWGINIEPVAEYYALFEEDRGRDINLCVAVGEKEEEREFFFVPGTGLSTLRPKLLGNLSAIQRVVPITTLAKIYEEHLVEYPRVDFLKIDVEGFEREVLLGNDWERFRPRFLCIESTLPNTEIEVWENWEPIVLNQGYKFLYFDGLNRFYENS